MMAISSMTGASYGLPAPADWMKAAGRSRQAAYDRPERLGRLFFKSRHRAGLPAPLGMKTAGSVGPSGRLRTDRPERL